MVFLTCSRDECVLSWLFSAERSSRCEPSPPSPRSSFLSDSSTSTNPTSCAIPLRGTFEVRLSPLFDLYGADSTSADTMVTPEIFASHLCDDLRLPLHPFYKEIVSQIKKHLEEAHLIEEYDAHLGDDLASVRDENRAWFETNSKRRKLGEELKDDEMEVAPNEEKVLLPRDFSGQEGQNDELRVLIKVS